jgi:hypothetical protein
LGISKRAIRRVVMGKEQIAGRAGIADIRVGHVMHASEIFHR